LSNQKIASLKLVVYLIHSPLYILQIPKTISFMKTSNLFRLLVIVGILTTTIWACQKTEVESTSVENDTFKSSGAKVAVGCSLYSLVLNGNSGTPVAAGLQSFIFKVNPCSGATGLVSQIKVGGITPVTCVTGLSNMLGVPGYAWAVTGKNSNFPGRILKVQIATGNASVGPATEFLQDLENNGTDYFAILEGTQKIFKVNVFTGLITFFAAPPTAQLNGLTFKGTTMYVISGTSSALCPPNSGDIWYYNSLLATPPPLGSGTYNNLPANSNWTMKELGFHLDFCCQKTFMVGSAGIPSVLSNRTTLACALPNPTFLSNIKPTYDFMIE
jgi:hypothetical protein